jgi:long-chain acyl-CoA synthetase
VYVLGALLSKAIQVKLKNLRETGSVTHPFWDRVVFKKTRALLGGNVTDITTGSAPINKDTLELHQCHLLREHVIEGWGMTENCAAGSRTLPNDRSSSGTVGTAQPCCELKLVDVPQMGYTSQDKPFPRGELCTRGPNTFKGYYKGACCPRK